MSFASMHNDYLDPDRAGLFDEKYYEFENEWPDQAQSFFWNHDNGELYAQRENGSVYHIAAYEGDDVLEAKQIIAAYFGNIERDCKLITYQLEKLKQVPTAEPYTWKEYWATMAEFMPEIVTGKPFEFDDQCDAESFPERDGDEWNSTAYSIDHGRGEDGLFIYITYLVGDGDWSGLDQILEGCTDEEFARFQHKYMTTDHWFAAWGEYFVWCALNGAVDPVETYWKPERCTHADLLKSAWEQVRYLEMGRK